MKWGSNDRLVCFSNVKLGSFHTKIVPYSFSVPFMRILCLRDNNGAQRIEEFSSKIKQIHFWVLLRKTGFFDGIYTHIYGKTKFRLKKKIICVSYLDLYHSVTSSNVILYNDVKNSIFIKIGFIWFWN